MPLAVRKTHNIRQTRVKSLALHPTQNWLLASLYRGLAIIYDEEGRTVKQIEVADNTPLRAAQFIPRKNWMVIGADDGILRVYNYNTLEKVHQTEAHTDYVRSIDVHPTLSFILTSSDDTTIKLWDWDKGLKCVMTFSGHTHYVMQIKFNPKDPNTFASASLDKTIKVWSLNSTVPNYTLEGHDKGVNTVDYYAGGDKPFLVSGADDRTVKIWDYQNKSCIQTLTGHSQNVSMVCYHPELPIIASISEDATVRLWNSNTYRLETTLNYGMERGWAVAVLKNSNLLALGFDTGIVTIKLGREDPAVSMDSSGKIIVAKHSEIQSANLKATGDNTEFVDGQIINLAMKDLGACEVVPQALQHSPNGRFVAVCGDGEWIIYTALAWRNKAFGSGTDFVWGSDTNDFAVRESTNKIQIFKKFERKYVITPNYPTEGIFGGALLAIRTATFVCFYDWETGTMIRRIDDVPTSIYWSDSGSFFTLCTATATYSLKYFAAVVAERIGSELPEDGVEEAFELVDESSDVVGTGTWIGECFIYTTASGRLNYMIGGHHSGTITQFDKPMYLLGYIVSDNRIYVCDKDLKISSWTLLLPVLEYQTYVIANNIEAAQALLPKIPEAEKSKLARFLEARGLKQLALDVTTDEDHRFELALALGDLNMALGLAQTNGSDSQWRMIGERAELEWRGDIAIACCRNAKDWAGLMLWGVASGDPALIQEAAAGAASTKANVAFTSNLLLRNTDECIRILQKSQRSPEAAFFSRTFAPSKLPETFDTWKNGLDNTKAAGLLTKPNISDPAFSDMKYALFLEHVMDRTNRNSSSLEWPRWKAAQQRDLISEIKREYPDGPPSIADLGRQQPPPPAQHVPAPMNRQLSEQPVQAIPQQMQPLTPVQMPPQQPPQISTQLPQQSSRVSTPPTTNQEKLRSPLSPSTSIPRQMAQSPQRLSEIQPSFSQESPQVSPLRSPVQNNQNPPSLDRTASEEFQQVYDAPTYGSPNTPAQPTTPYHQSTAYQNTQAFPTQSRQDSMMAMEQPLPDNETMNSHDQMFNPPSTSRAQSFASQPQSAEIDGLVSPSSVPSHLAKAHSHASSISRSQQFRPPQDLGSRSPFAAPSMSDTMSRVSLDVNTTGTGSVAAGVSEWGDDFDSPPPREGRSPSSDAYHSPDENGF